MTLRCQVIANAPDANIAEKLLSAVRALLEKDSKLLQLDAHERSISHRLALHLTAEFSQYDVDCEYNRDLHEPKRLHLAPECTSESGADGSRVFPDIIVHRRGTSCNLLVIEIKKSTSSVPDDCDIEKLRAFRDELGYRFAVFLRFACRQTDFGLETTRWI